MMAATVPPFSSCASGINKVTIFYPTRIKKHPFLVKMVYIVFSSGDQSRIKVVARN